MTLRGALVIMLAACGHAPEPAATTSPEPAAPPKPYVAPPLRRCEALGLDWCNRTYGQELEYVARELVGGHHEEHVYMCLPPHDGEHVTYLFIERDVVTGDLDGDGSDEALVVIDDIFFGCGDEGSHKLTKLIAHAVRDGVPTVMATTDVERRDDATFTIAGGQVVRTLVDGCIHRWNVRGAELVVTTRHCAR
jgi:hypothetical protein